MSEVTVPTGIPYGLITREQQAIVRMWLKIGLEVQVTGTDGKWIDLDILPTVWQESPLSHWYYRLKP